MINKFAVFWIGFIVALLIFGFCIPFLPHFEIEYTMIGSRVEWITAAATLVAVIVSLSIATFGESMSKWFYRSEMKLVDKLENIQPGVQLQGHTRLLFKNKGNATAHDVEIYVELIILKAMTEILNLYWSLAGVFTYEYIGVGETQVELTMFQESGEIKIFDLFLLWNKEDNLVLVTKYTERNT